jgi:hypothetical protein
MVTSKQNQIWSKENEIGVDKGYKTLLVSSSGNYYGEGLNKILSDETEKLNLNNKKRNPYYAMVRTLHPKRLKKDFTIKISRFIHHTNRLKRF